MTTVTVEFDCCGATYTAPTTIPAAGSALRHATTVDTVLMFIETQHATEHPDCPKEKP